MQWKWRSLMIRFVTRTQSHRSVNLSCGSSYVEAIWRKDVRVWRKRRWCFLNTTESWNKRNLQEVTFMLLMWYSFHEKSCKPCVLRNWPYDSHSLSGLFVFIWVYSHSGSNCCGLAVNSVSNCSRWNVAICTAGKKDRSRRTEPRIDIRTYFRVSGYTNNEKVLLFVLIYFQLLHSYERFSTYSFILSFILDISKASFKSTTTQRCSRLQHWFCIRVNMPKRYRQLQVKDNHCRQPYTLALQIFVFMYGFCIGHSWCNWYCQYLCCSADVWLNILLTVS